MDQTPSFQDFLTGQAVEIPLTNFVLNLFFAAVLGYALYHLYIRFGTALSNRRLFARNFILITMTTMLIITIVKSSLALSLGLVGALSIVRFRAAIKEPEELAYLFLCIAIGLGFGADQRMITLVAFVLIAAVIVTRGMFERGQHGENLHLTIASHNPSEVNLDQLVEALRKHASSVNLRRFDETQTVFEATFAVQFDSFEKLKLGKEALRALNDKLEITFLENRSAA